MGLLDELLGGVTGQGQPGNSNAAPAPAPQTALQGVVNLLHNPQVGGIGGLLQMFEQHGMGQTAQGWVGQGANPGVSSNQLMQVLGPALMGQFASHLGVPQQQAGGILAQLLPHVVDHMTPNGQVPAEAATPANAGGVFDMLKSRLLG